MKLAIIYAVVGDVIHEVRERLEIVLRAVGILNWIEEDSDSDSDDDEIKHSMYT